MPMQRPRYIPFSTVFLNTGGPLAHHPFGTNNQKQKLAITAKLIKTLAPFEVNLKDKNRLAPVTTNKLGQKKLLPLEKLSPGVMIPQMTQHRVRLGINDIIQKKYFMFSMQFNELIGGAADRGSDFVIVNYLAKGAFLLLFLFRLFQ